MSGARGRARAVLAKAARILLVSYALVVLIAALGQRWLLYPRFASKGLPVNGTRWFVPFDGGAVPLWFVPNGEAPDTPIVLWFHGNAEQLADTWWAEQRVTRKGLSFAAVEYPGYGASVGAGPTEDTLLAAARGALESLAATGRPIVCVGASLGTGPAVAMAAEGRCTRLALVSPYTSLAEAAQAVYPWLPGRWLVLDRMDSASRAPSIRAPTLIVHGTRDRTCPIWMGRTLAQSIPGARIVEEPRGHNDVLDEAVFDRLVAFALGNDGG